MTNSEVIIYVKVVEEDKRNKVIPGAKNYDFSSKNGYIFTYFKPYLLITEDELSRFKCKDCYLVIAVEVNEQSEDMLTIEVTQHMSVLING